MRFLGACLAESSSRHLAGLYRGFCLHLAISAVLAPRKEVVKVIFASHAINTTRVTQIAVVSTLCFLFVTFPPPRMLQLCISIPDSQCLTPYKIASDLPSDCSDDSMRKRRVERTLQLEATTAGIASVD